MALAQLNILVETPGSQLQFDDKKPGCCIVAMFNPNRLSLNRSAHWQSQQVAKRDCPELQFTGAEPGTLGIELFFDTYDSPDPRQWRPIAQANGIDDPLRLQTGAVLVLPALRGADYAP